MLVISACPKCLEQVSVPTGLDAAALVRCPLCNAEYALQEALPPALIPVAAAADQSSAAGSEVAMFLAQTKGKVEEPGAISMEQAADEKAELAEENAAMAVVGRASIAGVRVRRRPPKSALQTIIEVLTGGLAGCLVAYYGLAWYFGPDFKNVGLPVIPYSGVTWFITPTGKTGVPAKEPAISPALPKVSEPLTELPKQPAELTLPPAKPAPIEQLSQPPPTSKTHEEAAASSAGPKLLRPQPGTAEYLGPRMPPSVTSDQLGQALREVNTAIEADKAGEPMSPKAYQAMCRLGEALAFVNGDAADARLTDRIAAVGPDLEKMADRPERFDQIGRLAGAEIDAKSESPAGVLLAGAVKSVAKEGRLWNVSVELAGGSKSVSLLSDREVDVKVDDRVLVLGVVVRQPSATLVGYSGDQAMVVWSVVLKKAS